MAKLRHGRPPPSADQIFRPLAWIGAANGSGSSDAGTRLGPSTLWELSSELDGELFREMKIISESPTGSRRAALAGLVDFNRRLARATRSAVQQGKLPYVIGGDHACAIGTWSGIASQYPQPLGLLWIDAHMDAHTFISSETGNIHGMPLAALLGYGEANLTQISLARPKIDPLRTVLFGVRCFEKEEARLLERLQVRVYSMSEILERGFQTCWQEALKRVQYGGLPFGLSLDLDGLDPQLIPGVGTPVPQGLHPNLVLRAVRSLVTHPALAGLEVVEYNPLHDREGQSLSFLIELSHLVANRAADRGLAPASTPLAPWPSSLWPLAF